MNFAKIIKTGKDEGSEKHVPCIEIDKGHKSRRDIIGLWGNSLEVGK